MKYGFVYYVYSFNAMRFGARIQGRGFLIPDLHCKGTNGKNLLCFELSVHILFRLVNTRRNSVEGLNRFLTGHTGLLSSSLVFRSFTYFYITIYI
jgi:hypothetical protein